jgi:DNA-directed RNA polymerase subunit alpha
MKHTLYKQVLLMKMLSKMSFSSIKEKNLINDNMNALDQLNKFRVGPFTKKNEALTTMQVLRRTLLSNLQGIGIFGVYIPEVIHEFSVIPGLKEDTIELTLNLQTLVFKGHSSTPIIRYLECAGPGIITANNLKDLPPEITCLNSNQYIATVENNVAFRIHVLISTQPVPLPTNFLPVNTVPAPVKAVNFCIESEGKEDVDFCVLEIRTNGSISPVNAIQEALKRISFLFCLLETSFIPEFNSKGLLDGSQQTDKNSLMEVGENTSFSAVLKKVPIEKLSLSTRTIKCLQRHNIYTIYELMNYNKEQLLNLKNFGKKSLLEVTEKLRKFHEST